MTPPATAHGTVAVACSGGRDSIALLHACAVAARDAGVEVVALHVHHGLSAHADDWLAHVENTCERWRRRGLPVRFAAERLAGQPAAGDSVEAWARRGRYAALARLARSSGCSTVLLAHHRGDQAETFLLQALRGAGMAGLAAMPRVAERDGITWIRPWLAHSREAIEAYVRRHRLRHVDDDSNADPRFARNRLRQAVWPALEQAFEGAQASLADAARWAAQAQANLADLAALDLAAVADAAGLRIADWSTLPEHRRANALREWLRAQSGRAPSSATARRLLAELPGARSGRWPLPEGELRVHRGHARCLSAQEDSRTPREAAVSLTRAGRHALPGWGGTLVVRRVREGGVPLAWLAHAELRPRQGGERFQAGPGRPPRSLKKQFQAADVPAWLRDGPLLWSGGQLVFVPGLGLDARVVGLPGQPLVMLVWEGLLQRSS